MLLALHATLPLLPLLVLARLAPLPLRFVMLVAADGVVGEKVEALETNAETVGVVEAVRFLVASIWSMMPAIFDAVLLMLMM